MNYEVGKDRRDGGLYGGGGAKEPQFHFLPVHVNRFFRLINNTYGLSIGSGKTKHSRDGSR